MEGGPSYVHTTPSSAAGRSRVSLVAPRRWGVLLIFSSKPLIMRVFMHPPESEISTLLLAALKEMGGLALMVSVMLFLASRDLERNVAVVDGVDRGPSYPRRNALAFALHPGHPADLPWPPHLGAFGGQAGDSGIAVLAETTGEALAACGEFLRNGRER